MQINCQSPLYGQTDSYNNPAGYCGEGGGKGGEQDSP